VDCKEVDPRGMGGRAYYREREGMDPQEEASGFNGDWALKYMEEIAFPRRTGTQGEQKAAQTILRILNELGYETREEDFSILLAPRILIKGIFFISLLFLISTWLTLEKIPWVSFFLSGFFFWDLPQEVPSSGFNAAILAHSFSVPVVTAKDLTGCQLLYIIWNEYSFFS
jgi:hypothetical protein